MTSLELVLDLDTAADTTAQHAAAAAQLKITPDRIQGVRLRKRSIDARSRAVKVRLQVDVFVDESMPPVALPSPNYHVDAGKSSVVIVGFGPAGIFAALRCLEMGIQPIVLERGKDVQARRRDLAAINRRGEVNTESNYCFGEGGAGTYSDGKLYTRATKRGSVETVLQTLVAHGAHPDILVEAHPHIGSNKLPKVVQAMRQSILEAGGEVHFGEKVVELLLEEWAGGRRIAGVRTASGREWLAGAVVLATGHSARDIYHLLHSLNVRLETKPFAMGVRIEHPQPLIDRIQYHRPQRDERLPAASYRLAHTVNERGVFSFCMCPGGWIVPAATEPDEVVVNGMSLSRRDSPFANSGIVVGVEPADLEPFAGHGVLAGLRYQKQMEVVAAVAGGGHQAAPAQRLTDFISGKVSASLPETSYQPGLASVAMSKVLPPPIGDRLRKAFVAFNKSMPGYLTEQAVIVGVESRTSSPVRIPRDDNSLQHPEVAGLYPCGEGAGYAGGIVSAAMDGMRVADALARAAVAAARK